MSDEPSFEATREQAGELLADEDVDALYVAVTRSGEMDSAFAQRAQDADTAGMRALSLLARHVQVVAEETGLPPEQVAADAATLADRLGGDGGPEPGDGADSGR